MKNNLRQFLNQKIQEEGYLTLDQVHQIAVQMGHKESTAERELRPSTSPNVKAYKNDKGHITGYGWHDTLVIEDEKQPYATVVDYYRPEIEIIERESNFMREERRIANLQAELL